MSAALPKWTDATSYSQREPHPRVPRVWELKFRGWKISVFTGHIHYPPGTWLLDCYELGIEKHELLATTADVARHEGLIEVREKLGQMTRDLETVQAKTELVAPEVK